MNNSMDGYFERVPNLVFSDWTTQFNRVSVVALITVPAVFEFA
jgi:hypothetical protein